MNAAGEALWIGPGPAGTELTPEIVGAKAADIARMARLGLHTPPAFVLPTDLCAQVCADPATAASLVAVRLRAGIERLEAATGRRLGDPRAPLLVSVRSGAARSMPGMLDTVLNVGLNAESVHGLIRLSGDPRFAWDSYRRFLESYATVVTGAPAAQFSERLAAAVHAEGAADESELDGEALERLAAEFQDFAGAQGQGPIPEDPMDQLIQASLAVFASWEGHRAREYRRLNHLEDLKGTAVTVQAMVFGNAGRRSGAGVAFSRNPSTGEKGLYVDFLFDAQGEDVVSGRRTPSGAERLCERLPEAFAELQRGADLLERDRADIQDIEFTVQDGELYFLQTRSAKRTPRAALRAAVAMVGDGILERQAALNLLAGFDLARATMTRFCEPAPALARGIPASAGVSCGRASFTSASAKRLAGGGEPVVLVRPEPTTDDIEGFAAATGILTARGGRTAHAAVVARQMAKVCVVGCGELQVSGDGGGGALAGQPLQEGDWLWLDGDSGEAGLGKRTIVADTPDADLAEVERWRSSETLCA
jgi:pyruvate, orthophosphate dikinase